MFIQWICILFCDRFMRFSRLELNLIKQEFNSFICIYILESVQNIENQEWSDRATNYINKRMMKEIWEVLFCELMRKCNWNIYKRKKESLNRKEWRWKLSVISKFNLEKVPVNGSLCVKSSVLSLPSFAGFFSALLLQQVRSSEKAIKDSNTDDRAQSRSLSPLSCLPK